MLKKKRKENIFLSLRRKCTSKQFPVVENNIQVNIYIIYINLWLLPVPETSVKEKTKKFGENCPLKLSPIRDFHNSLYIGNKLCGRFIFIIIPLVLLYSYENTFAYTCRLVRYEPESVSNCSRAVRNIRANKIIPFRLTTVSGTVDFRIFIVHTARASGCLCRLFRTASKSID